VSRCGDLYENKITGERAVVLRGDQDGHGQSALVHLTVRPHGAVVGEHIHPQFRGAVSGHLRPAGDAGRWRGAHAGGRPRDGRGAGVRA
jgi:hypothetical protein